jgi:hypothetical protein
MVDGRCSTVAGRWSIVESHVMTIELNPHNTAEIVFYAVRKGIIV